MMNETLSASIHLANNVESLRKAKNFSQQRLAELAEIPRSTISHIESGAGNPSLSNLCKVAAALSVSIEELLSRPRNECMLIKADQVPVEKKAKGAALQFKLMPDKIKGIEIDRIELRGNATLSGQPHLPGTKEYLMVIKGEVTVFIKGDAHTVSTGDVLAFSGNQPHSYKNFQSKDATAISVVLPLPHVG